MKISILLISWSAICFAGTPWHETSVHCSFGCVLAQLPDQKEISICANMPFKLMPDTDNMYHIKIYSGFPVGQDHLQHTVPGYEQEYTWWDDYGQVMLDLSNCWKGSKALLFSPQEKIGLCPPQKYNQPPNLAARTNPYWLYQSSFSQSSSLSDEATISLANDANTNDPNFALLDNQQLSSSLFFSGENSADIAGFGAGPGTGTGAGANPDQFIISDSPTDSIFFNGGGGGGDQLLFSSDSDSTNDKLDSAFVASNDGVGQGGRDYSLFDGTA